MSIQQQLPTRAASRGIIPATIAVLALFLTGWWLLYTIQARNIAEDQKQRESIRLELMAQLLQSELRHVASDLQILADGAGLRQYIENGSSAGLQAAARQARTAMLQDSRYDKIRVIDTQGSEVLRINQDGSSATSLDLQDKSDRYFFQRANALPPGSLYVSAFDLDVEHGEIEVPFESELRLAVPLFDAAGNRHGIYIINYLGSSLIERLQQAAGAFGHRLRILDSKGNWIKASDAAHEWGAVLPERQAFSMARTNPALWARMRAEPLGATGGTNDLLTWNHLTPDEFGGSIQGRLVAEDDALIIASEIAPAEWAALFSRLRLTMLLLAAAISTLILLSAGLFLGRRKAAQALRATNLQLEQRVQERTAELAQSNELLKEREQLLEQTGTLAKVGGCKFSPETGEGFWTPEFKRIYDLDPSVEPTPELGFSSFSGAGLDRLHQALQKAQTEGTPYDLELPFVSATGIHKWVRTMGGPEFRDGKVAWVRGALQDITEQKQAQLDLQVQLQRMNLLERTTRAIGDRQDLASILQVLIRTLEEQMPLDFGATLLFDSATRTLTVATLGAASKALALQMSMPENATVPIDENGLSRCIAGQLVHEPDISGVDFEFPRRLSATGLHAVVIAPLKIESDVFGVLVAARREPQSFSSGDCEFLRQVSEHAALAAHQARLYEALETAYEDLRNTQQAVMQQDRLRVLGQMASGIAHDINNAISPIMLYTESLLAHEQGLSQQARSSLAVIQQAVGDVAQTVTRMREFYRQREPQTELRPVDLNALASQVLDLTRARWASMPQQQGIAIEPQLVLVDDLPLVQGIESEIREALINLVFNAVDAMPAGGTLTLRTGVAGPDGAFIEVADSGTGMAPETRQRCLEPFFSTKGDRGTGLGLPMVYGVMRRHGGTVDIDSTPHVGTRVRLDFSLAGSLVATGKCELPVAQQPLHVLVIDDDPLLLGTLRETLEMDGHRVICADSGQRGIDLFRQSLQPGAEHYAMVFTDLGMPYLDGRQVAVAIKQASPDTPVVLLTGWGERLLAERERPPGVDRVLAKPPRLNDLRATLSDLASRA